MNVELRPLFQVRQIKSVDGHIQSFRESLECLLGRVRNIDPQQVCFAEFRSIHLVEGYLTIGSLGIVQDDGEAQCHLPFFMSSGQPLENGNRSVSGGEVPRARRERHRVFLSKQPRT